MKKLLLVTIAAFLFNGCGGGSPTPPPPPPPVATHLSLSAATSTSTVGIAFNITVKALDASGSVVPSYSGTVHFTSTDAKAVLLPNSTLTNGTGAFSVTLNTVGSQTIAATDTAAPTITGTSNSIMVSVAVVTTHFSITAPASAFIGTPFNFTVTALDASNNVVTSYSGTAHFSSGDPLAVLPANSKLTNGVGNFSATLKFCCGDQSITATDTVTSSITGTSNPINASGGPLTHFSIIAPPTATLGMPLNFSVTALDASNNVVTIYSGTVHFTSSDSQALLPADSTLAFGVGNFSATLKTLGGQTIKAADTATPSITGTSNSINVTTNAATHFSLTVPTSVNIKKPFNFTVAALDASNNVATGYTGAVHFTSSDVKAVLPTDSALFNGTANFSATLNTVGSQTITATDTIIPSISGTSNSIGVFSTCTPKGAQCPPFRPPCCPGLVCAAGGNRHFCFPTSAQLDRIARSPQGPENEWRFAATCTMGTARESHTATLLGNGLVLITGGDDRTVSLATAELFNPETHSFAPTSHMASARAEHTSTLLTNGSVLVIGGRDASGNALVTAELFDPERGSFAPTGSLRVPRQSHIATLLGTGKVLVAGGNNAGVTLAAAELYDPARGLFAPAGSMNAARGFHTATLLKNGKVLVIGGRDAEGHVLATAELFDPITERFMAAGSMSTPRESHTATLLPDGKVLITGGGNGTEILATAELFDPNSGSFTPLGPMHAVREFHTATLRKNGSVVVAGGATLTATGEGSALTSFLPESTATAELFDPASGTFAPTSDMANARARGAAVLLPDGKVLVTGGINPDISALAESLASAELFQ